jgi:hypothetical protein
MSETYFTGGATGVSTDPTFTWSAVPDATAYRIMIATSAAALPRDPAADSCATCVINVLQTLPSFTPPLGVLRPAHVLLAGQGGGNERGAVGLVEHPELYH